MNYIGAPLYLYRIFKKEHLKSLIASASFYLSDPMKFNDPYDCFQGIDFYASKESTIDLFLKRENKKRSGENLSDNQLNSRKNKINSLNEMYRESLSKVIGHMGVFCFTENIDSMLMWAHYGDNHKNFAVRFSTKYLPKSDFYLWPVDYVASFPTLEEVIFNEDLVSSDNKPYLKMRLARKSLEWGYEKEWRLISLNYPLKVRYITYQKQFIDSIYFGCKTPKSEIEEIQRLLTEHNFHIKQFVMEVDASNFKIFTRLL